MQPDQSVLDYLLDYNAIIYNRKSNAQCDFVYYFGQKYPYWDEIKTEKHDNADGNSHHGDEHFRKNRHPGVANDPFFAIMPSYQLS